MIWKTAEPTTKKSSRPTTRGPYFKPPSSCEHTMRLLTEARDNTLCFTHLLLLVKTAPGDALSVLLGPQALSTRNARATEHVAGVALKRKESDASKKQTKKPQSTRKGCVRGQLQQQTRPASHSIPSFQRQRSWPAPQWGKRGLRRSWLRGCAGSVVT